MIVFRAPYTISDKNIRDGRKVYCVIAIDGIVTNDGSKIIPDRCVKEVTIYYICRNPWVTGTGKTTAAAPAASKCKSTSSRRYSSIKKPEIRRREP